MDTAGWKTGDKDVLVAFLTDTGAGQSVAYRNDNGRTFTWYEANPVVCEGSDGDLVFVWPNSGLGTLQMQRLNRQGTPRFAARRLAL